MQLPAIKLASIAEIKQAYSPQEKYRVSAFRYETDTKFNGIGRAGLCFCLKGEVTFYYQGQQKQAIASGEVALLPQGEYDFSVVKGPAEIVRVWDIEEIVCQQSK